MTSDEIHDLMVKCRAEASAKRSDLVALAHVANWPSDGSKLVELAEEMGEFLLDEFSVGPG